MRNCRNGAQQVKFSEHMQPPQTDLASALPGAFLLGKQPSYGRFPCQ